MPKLVDFLIITAFALIGYLLGSINAGVLVSRVRYRDDVRKHGSGNAGTTNMLRTYGKSAAALTLIIDFSKGIVACFLPCLIVYVAMKNHALGLNSMMAAACGCVCGHNWPCYFGFKGGKGVLVTFSVMLCLAPLPALLALLTFIIVVAITRFVSLGSVLAAAVYPVFVLFIGGWPENTKGLTTFLIISILLAGLLIVRHYANIGRLIKGKESKLSFKSKPKVEQPSEETQQEQINEAETAPVDQCEKTETAEEDR